MTFSGRLLPDVHSWFLPIEADREVVESAVNQNGCALEFASPGLRDDSAIVWQAQNQTGLAVTYASNRLQCKPEVQLGALRRPGWRFRQEKGT